MGHACLAGDLRRLLSAMRSSPGKSLNVEIDSPGGDVFAGLAMYNALKSSGKTINVKITGIAASAASVIAMAGNTIEMPENTFMMVHNPWTASAGNADELRKDADVLDKIGNALLTTYVAKTGQTPAKIAELLSAETWLSAQEAKDLGFATAVTAKVQARARFDLERAALPARVRAVYADAPALADEIAALVKAAGLEAYASHLTRGCTTIEEAEARTVAAREIVALCRIAKRPQDARAAILGNKPVDEVRAVLLKTLPDPAARRAKSTSQVYSERNARR